MAVIKLRSSLLNPAQIEETRKFAVDLRTSGLTYAEIGKRLGIDPTYAGTLVRGALKRISNEEVSDLVKIEAARLDKLQYIANKSMEVIFNRLAVAEEDGQPLLAFIVETKELQQLIASNLSVMERRAKMLGLDAPKRTELTGLNGGPIETVWEIEVRGIDDKDKVVELPSNHMTEKKEISA